MNAKKTYKVCNGTYYHSETPNELIHVLEHIRGRKYRVNMYYGDTKTCLPWGDDKETGTIGRSMGPVKIPLAIYNARSMGGGGILDHCIIKIECANKKGRVVWYDLAKKYCQIRTGAPITLETR